MYTLRNNVITDSMDILCLTESWLKKDLPDTFVTINKFSIARNDRQCGRGGGTCVYTTDMLKYHTNVLPVNDVDVEIQSVCITANGSDQIFRPITIVLAYRPPKGSSLFCLPED